MKLTGLHLLMTFKCTNECDHCFIWGSPRQSGTMTIENIRNILHQAKDTKTINSIYFEGGEPFLYYPVMLRGIIEANDLGFDVGVVSNGYWATENEDAIEWLRPLKGLINDISISSDVYHWDKSLGKIAENTREAAAELGIPVGYISIAQPEKIESESVKGQLPAGDSKVMYKGRAAENLVQYAEMKPWNEFRECPHEDFREPGRVHVDPFGNLHICQGISIGNMFEKPLQEICSGYIPEEHPVIGHLLKGGPAGLAQHYKFRHEEGYADACHLCYEIRKHLMEEFPDILTPLQAYGVVDEY